MNKSSLFVKKRFADEMKRCCAERYSKIPSNAKLAKDFYYSTNYSLNVNRETVRKWLINLKDFFRFFNHSEMGVRYHLKRLINDGCSSSFHPVECLSQWTHWITAMLPASPQRPTLPRSTDGSTARYHAGRSCFCAARLKLPWRSANRCLRCAATLFLSVFA